MNWPFSMATALMPLFDRYPEFSQRLARLGFDDALFFDSYLDSFAQTNAELALSRKIRAEIACRACWSDCFLVARTSPTLVLQRPAPFDGNWLDQMLGEKRRMLRASGDAEMAERLTLTDLDPCRLRERAWASENHANSHYLTIEFPALQLRRREEEALGSRLVPSRMPVDHAAAIMDFVEECLLLCLRDRSYRRIKRSDSEQVIVCKRLTDDVELRFVVHDNAWSFSRFPASTVEGRLAPFQANCLDLSLGLHLRSGRIRRFGGIPRAEIPFTRLAPFCDQGKYRNATHIAIAIAGWISLYRMVAKEVEEAALACWRAARH
jgi:hypothetical protein